ncbi:MAG: cytochrome c [Myxococcales bacterium]|nr:cytochrome c [Myxococcales bacterium]MCB9524151.1 cytochrome c [Myxococcales bacterium]
MLSKSAARAFFLGGTVLTGLVFIGMTVDTHRQAPARTNTAALTDEVKAGHVIWTENNCMGCHTLLGEGAYYAPELTKVISRRGKPWIRAFIKDPEAMFPGRRKMVKYDFTDEQIEHLLTFFEWIEGIDTNGFPADPPYKPVDGPVAAGSLALADAPEKFKALCVACHKVGGKGGIVGPALDDVRARYDRPALDRWIQDPQAVKPGTAMPKLPLSDPERAAIVDYLLGAQ